MSEDATGSGLGGSTGQPAAGGASGGGAAGGATAARTNGGASVYGRLVRGVLPEHDHETPSTGGELDAYLGTQWGTDHLAAADPHAGYATDADVAGVAGGLADHLADADPHPAYVTEPEGDLRWQPLGAAGAVESVNGQTGVVVLDAADVGALTEAQADADYAALDHTHSWPTAAREYQFATNTNVGVDPGNGFLRTNTGNVVTATVLTLDTLTQNNFDIAVILRALVAGDVVFIQDKDLGSNWVRFRLSAAPADMSGWWRLDGAPQAGAGAITTAQLVAVVCYLEGGTGGGAGGAVTSVNGEVGDVVLSADDVGALDAADLTAHTALGDAHHPQGHNHTAADGSGALSNEEHDGYSQYANLGADPSTPAANRIRVYARDNGSGIATLYYITENGTVYEIPTLTGGGNGSGAPANASYVTLATESKLSQETALGAGVIMSGTLAARPAFGTAGRLYLATDAGVVYRDSGAAWAAFAAASGYWAAGAGTTPKLSVQSGAPSTPATGDLWVW